MAPDLNPCRKNNAVIQKRVLMDDPHQHNGIQQVRQPYIGERQFNIDGTGFTATSAGVASGNPVVGLMVVAPSADAVAAEAAGALVWNVKLMPFLSGS